MYPVLRLALEAALYRNAPPLGVLDTHVSRHRCWPQDIDLWRELNNGRTLTLYDLGRVVLFQRTGVSAAMRRRGWVGTVAGVSVRYRRRVRLFDPILMRSRVTGWDARFLYLEQSMWRPEGNGDQCTSHMLLRAAVTSSSGLVPVADALDALGHDLTSPTLPDWIAAWSQAEAQRPWPPAD